MALPTRFWNRAASSVGSPSTVGSGACARPRARRRRRPSRGCAGPGRGRRRSRPASNASRGPTHPGEGQQVVDQLLHALGAVDGELDVLVGPLVELPLVAALEQLAEARHLAQRLLQVVGGDVGELLQVGVGAGQLLGLGGQLLAGLLDAGQLGPDPPAAWPRCRRPAHDLRRPDRLDRPVELAGGDLAGLGPQRVERAQRPSGSAPATGGGRPARRRAARRRPPRRAGGWRCRDRRLARARSASSAVSRVADATRKPSKRRFDSSSSAGVAAFGPPWPGPRR